MPHSEKSLFQLKSFRFALWTPICIAILIVIYILITSNLTFKSGFSGVNNLWGIFKVPLAIFSLAFPSVALVTANHRSIQSKKQIEATENQNIFANYYKHLEEFKVLLEDHNILNDISNYRQLHLKLFPNVKLGDYEITADIRSNLISDFLNIYNKLKELEDLSNNLLESDDTDTIKMEKILKGLVRAYKPMKSTRKYFQFNLNDQDAITDAGLAEYKEKIQMYNYISAISQTANMLKEVCKFSSKFKIPFVMIAISELEQHNDLIGGIPINRALNFNLPLITVDGESRSFSQ